MLNFFTFWTSIHFNDTSECNNKRKKKYKKHSFGTSPRDVMKQDTEFLAEEMMRDDDDDDGDDELA